MIVDFNEPIYTYDKLKADAAALAESYNSILQCVTIGQSHDNRDILLIKLGIGRRHLICCSGVHGRESVNPIVLMKIIEYYAKAYISHKNKKGGPVYSRDSLGFQKTAYEQMLFESCVQELLHTFTILFVPLLNPDGYMISLLGFQALKDEGLKKHCKDKRVSYQEWKFNGRCVDINRNFPSRLWKPKYPGDYVASENETKALIYLFHEYPSFGFLDVHSRGNTIYYYRSMMSERYNQKQLKIADRLKEITGYELVPPSDEVETGDSGGNTVHYYSEHFRRPAFTLETVEDEAVFPLNNQYRQRVFDEIKLVIFEFGSLIL